MERSSSSEEGFLNSSCTTTSSSAQNSSSSASPSRSIVERAMNDETELNITSLPDGVLERIYGFCPHFVVAHLSVCKRFLQHLPFAEAVWLRPKMGAKRGYFVPSAGGRSHPAVETRSGAPNWALASSIETSGSSHPPPLCQPHWSAPPAHTYTASYHHKDYPGDSTVSTAYLGGVNRYSSGPVSECANVSAVALPSPHALAQFKGKVLLHMEDERWVRMSACVYEAVVDLKWSHLDSLLLSSADLSCRMTEAAGACVPRAPNVALGQLCAILVRLHSLRRLQLQDCRLMSPGILLLNMALGVAGGQCPEDGEMLDCRLRRHDTHIHVHLSSKSGEASWRAKAHANRGMLMQENQAHGGSAGGGGGNEIFRRKHGSASKNNLCQLEELDLKGNGLGKESALPVASLVARTCARCPQTLNPSPSQHKRKVSLSCPSPPPPPSLSPKLFLPPTIFPFPPTLPPSP